MSFSFKKLVSGLARTQTQWVERVRQVLGGRTHLDAETLATLEETLLSGDVGVEVASEMLELLKEGTAAGEDALAVLEARLADRLRPNVPASPLPKPHVTVLVGVNGTGKTTTAGKLAARFSEQGARVLVAGCDTFRAAATDQLKWWGEKAGAEVVLGQPEGDPSAVAFDAVQKARARGLDRVIIDTAGRLHTRTGLMAELEKLKRVTARALPGAPHDVFLVLDATTGQNGLTQAREFHRALGLTGVVLTKLDGTAKGGIVFAIRDALEVPVRYVGLGEGLDDLDEFDPTLFVKALFAGRPEVGGPVAAGGT